MVDLAHFACSLTCITLREYAAKLQLLKSPKESQHPISSVPEIHADPELSVNYESEHTRCADNSKKDENLRPRYSGSPQNGKKPMSPDPKAKEEGSTWTENRIAKDINASGPDSLEKHSNQVNITNSATGGRDEQAMLRSEMQTSTAADSVGKTLATNNIETEKLWHYRDPNGKIQGPFSMMHLRQWSTTGLFPPDMRIWTNHELFDSLLLTHALNGKFHGASELPHNRSSESQEHSATGGSKTINQNDADSKPAGAACSNNLSVLSDNNSVPVRADEPSWPQCWDLLKDNNSTADRVPAHSSLPSSRPGQMFVALPDRVQESDNFNRGQENTEKKSSGATQNETTGHGLHNKTDNQNQAVQSSEEKLRSLPIDLSLNDIESSSIFEPVSKLPDLVKQDGILDVSDLLSPRRTGEIQATGKQQSASSNVPTQNSVILELLSPAPRSNNEEQGGQASETRQSRLLNFPVPNSGPSWGSASNLVVGGVRFPEVADEWYSPTTAKPSGQDWICDLGAASSLKPPEVTNDNVGTSDSFQLTHVSPSHPTSNIPNWLAMINEPIEFDALGEESVSDLLAEVDAMESQGGLPSPTSAMKFAKELSQDRKDDCFTSIEDFSPTRDPGKSDALSSSSEIQLNCQSGFLRKPSGSPPIDALDSFSRSGVHSSGSSMGETNAPVYTAEAGSEFHPPAGNNMNQDMVGAAMAPGMGSESMDPSWGTVQGNINLVTVQGNVNLVLCGPGQGMDNLGWGTNPGTTWGNPNLNHGPISGSLPWDSQRKFGGERFTSPREWGYQGGEPGFGRGRPPWGRAPYGGGGGYSRPLPKGQRVCKFYESGRCKKGAFCDYLHP
ncbi:Zinc finger CCCH domain-containing protein 44 [Sesamum alatum]|uniref:Zinc finger CCCH domain-containing protein 44 n=1 Tax=Sesamum alatum TaxID=300844 RepID=A0AAE1YI70_9LAMI|nr:Zinc finger CCCH domain-containing protein 44 [Sesamum alatum]